MMENGITTADITFFITVAGALAALWWRIEAAITAVRKDCMEDIDEIRADLASYKIKVAEDYAKNGFIRDVENRVVTQIDKVAKEIHGLREGVDKVLTAWATSAAGKSRAR